MEVKNGTIQEVPFKLQTSLKDAPKNVKVKYSFNDQEKDMLDENITKEGRYTVYAKIYSGKKLLKAISHNFVAVK